MITPETREYLEKLEPAHVEEEVGLFHASPRDPVWEYVLSPLQAELCLDAQSHRVCLIGHSHVALSFSRADGESATGQTRGPDEQLDISQGEWLINPGSVGQPRDGDPARRLARARPGGVGGGLPPHRVRHRRRGRGDPGRPAARFAGRAPLLRAVSAAAGRRPAPS